MKIALTIGVLGLTALLFLGGSQILPFGAQKAEIEALSAQLTTERSNFATREDAMVAKLAVLQADHDLLSKTLAEVQAAGTVLTSEKAQLAQEVTALTGQLAEQTSHLDEAHKASEGLKARIADAGATIEELQNEAELLRAREMFLNGSSQKKIDALQKEHDAQSKSIVAAKEKISNLETSLAEKGSALDASQQQVSAMSEKIAAQEASLRGQSDALKSAEQRIAGLLGELSTTQDAFDQKANELLINQLKVSVLRDELDGLKDDVKDQENYAALLRADLTTSTQRAVMSCQTQTDSLLADNGISFRGGSATISYDSESVLDQVAQIALECAESNLVLDIEGHTDNVGRRDSNLVLSMARANAVRDFLAERGVAESTMRAAGYGESDPIADNSTRDGQLQNRRIVLDWDAPRPAILTTN